MTQDYRDGLTLQELQKLLAQQGLEVDDRTLRNWIGRLEITLMPDRLDKRRRLMRREDADRLIALAARGLQPAGSQPTSTVANDIANEYGLDDRTRRVLEDALDLRDKAPLGGLHVLLAAIRRERESLPPQPTPLLTALLTDPAVRNPYEATITMRLRHVTEEDGEEVAVALYDCLAYARNHVRAAHVTLVAVIWAILCKDPTVDDVFSVIPAQVRIEKARLIAELEAIIQPAFLGAPARTFVSVVDPTPDQRFAARHHTTLELVFQAMAERRRNQLVVCEGLSGSPIDRLDGVLVDLIADRNYLTYDSQLGQYTQVMRVDIGELRTLAGAADQATAAQQLVDGLRAASTRGAILVVSRMELLLGDEPVNKRLLLELMATGDVPVVALYTLVGDDALPARQAFPDLNAHTVLIPKYSVEHTINVMSKYYGFRWRAEGFDLPGEELDDAAKQGLKASLARALETVFALEPLVTEDGKRRTLPYLAVDVVKAAGRIIKATTLPSASPELLKAKALTADAHLECLIHGKEAIAVGEELKRIKGLEARSHNQATQAFIQAWEDRLGWLVRAQDEVRALAENPSADLNADNGRLLISRAIINACLFDGSRYEFAFLSSFHADVVRQLPQHAVAVAANGRAGRDS